MLGELIAESHGKRSARRVLSIGPTFKVEVSFEDKGKILGVEAQTICTYWAEARPDGSLYGEGEAVVVTRDGDTVTWKGLGVGGFREGGAISYRGAVCFHTASSKLSRLNTVAGVFEFDVDADGNTHAKTWEWK